MFGEFKFDLNGINALLLVLIVFAALFLFYLEIKKLKFQVEEIKKKLNSEIKTETINRNIDSNVNNVNEQNSQLYNDINNINISEVPDLPNENNIQNKELNYIPSEIIKMEEINKENEETNFEKIILSSDNESLDNESSDNESSDNESLENESSDNESLGSISDIEEILSNATLEKQNNEFIM